MGRAGVDRLLLNEGAVAVVRLNALLEGDEGGAVQASFDPLCVGGKSSENSPELALDDAIRRTGVDDGANESPNPLGE